MMVLTHTAYILLYIYNIYIIYILLIIIIDVYMFPCRGASASTQVDDMISDLKSSGLWGPVSEQELIELDKTKHEREERYRIQKEKNGNNYVAKGLRAGYTRKEKELIRQNGKLDRKRINNIMKNLNDTIIKQNGKIPKWRQDAIDATYGMIWFDIEVKYNKLQTNKQNNGLILHFFSILLLFT